MINLHQRYKSLIIIGFFLFIFKSVVLAEDINQELKPDKTKSQIPVASQMTTDLAGSSGATAIPSVFRVFCKSKNKVGTGFLHRSNKIITAAHVVSECDVSMLLIIGVSGTFKVKDVVLDKEIDVALIEPQTKIPGKALSISISDNYSIGLQVSTWGFPSGYGGIAPLLSSGYLSGIDSVQTESGTHIKQWVVNAAFNSGNSGGPLVDIETGNVIGVVSSKLAPIPKDIEQALEVMKHMKAGIGGGFVRKRPDGTTENLTHTQVIAEILTYLRSQTQLVIGYAVMINDLREFLKSKGIDP